MSSRQRPGGCEPVAATVLRPTSYQHPRNQRRAQMPPAARVGDLHVCPMVTPGVPPVPHVGGPILPPGCPAVLIGGQPAARVGDLATCVGPPDTIALGSATSKIGGQPAARQGDQTAHGGVIAVGDPTV